MEKLGLLVVEGYDVQEEVSLYDGLMKLHEAFKFHEGKSLLKFEWAHYDENVDITLDIKAHNVSNKSVVYDVDGECFYKKLDAVAIKEVIVFTKDGFTMSNNLFHAFASVNLNAVFRKAIKAIFFEE